jgi:hypothetical protein
VARRGDDSDGRTTEQDVPGVASSQERRRYESRAGKRQLPLGLSTSPRLALNGLCLLRNYYMMTHEWTQYLGRSAVHKATLFALPGVWPWETALGFPTVIFSLVIFILVLCLILYSVVSHPSKRKAQDSGSDKKHTRNCMVQVSCVSYAKELYLSGVYVFFL